MSELNKNKLSKSTYLIYGLGVSYFMLDQLYNQWLTYYYLPPATEKTLIPLLKPHYLVIAFIIARFIDALFDPLVGYWSDNCRSKFGRRSFFMGIGALPLGILMIMYFYPPKINQMSTLIYLSVVGGLFFIVYTFVGGPYNALIPDLAKTRKERLSLSTVQSTFRLIFTAIAVIFPGMLIKYFGGDNTEVGIRKTVILLTIIAISGVYLSIFLLKEWKRVDIVEKNSNISLSKSFKYLRDKEIIYYFIGFFMFFSGFNILRGSLTYYLTIVMKLPLNNMTIITALLFGMAGISFPITKKLSEKFSYKKVLIWDILLLIIGTAGLLIGTENSKIFIYVMFLICGFGLSGSAFIFPQAILSELTVKLTETKGVRLEGFLFGIQGLFLKLAFLAQQIVISLFIVFGSEVRGNGLKNATETGVRVVLVMALMFFITSVLVYRLKKED